MLSFISVNTAELTAIAVCIGSCGGITQVMIITQCSNSSNVLRDLFCKPCLSTYPDEIIANTIKKKTLSKKSTLRVTHQHQSIPRIISDLLARKFYHPN